MEDSFEVDEKKYLKKEETFYLIILNTIYETGWNLLAW